MPINWSDILRSQHTTAGTTTGSPVSLGTGAAPDEVRQEGGGSSSMRSTAQQGSQVARQHASSSAQGTAGTSTSSNVVVGVGVLGPLGSLTHRVEQSIEHWFLGWTPNDIPDLQGKSTTCD